MARTIKDFTLNLGKYNKLEEVDEKNAFVLAVRNILLSKPGNFPLTPNLGMDIEQYLFEPADEYTLNKIKTVLNRQISDYVDNASNVTVDAVLLEDTVPFEDGSSPMRYILGISVAATVDNDRISTNFLIYRDNNLLNIYNEVN